MAVQDKILVVLGAFSIERPSMTLSEIARATELPMSTVHRLVAHLTSWGALERDSRQRYAIGLRLWQLGTLSPAAYQQRALVVPFLEQLFVDTRRSVGLSVFRPGGDIVVEQSLGWRDADFAAGLGERLPVHASSPGLILLAFGRPHIWRALAKRPLRRYTSRTIVDPAALRRAVERVRKTSIAVSEGALVATTSSVSAPVFGHDGDIYGAVSVVWTTKTADAAELAPRVLSTANRVSAAMRDLRDELHPHPVRRGVFDPSRAGDAIASDER
ncbi:IclR family transcriptional regulator [Microbacterium sp.]|uniref:IclR family transcriptional regulator n=1 Tax=Microbacterium sp. TaxID=51671 RepID=UPI002E37659F|nr:IclR family transcriptional regulator [Microbacterium sp.]HEX5731028.1 IclR family transcriptional regulator [Microbacterium sp.]